MDTVLKNAADIDSATRASIGAFLQRLKPTYDVTRAVLFGSRATGHFHDDSDADLMILFPGERETSEKRLLDLRLRLANLAFDTLLETGVRIQVLPVWEAEWANRRRFSNPALLDDVAATGVVMT